MSGVSWYYHWLTVIINDSYSCLICRKLYCRIHSRKGNDKRLVVFDNDVISYVNESTLLCSSSVSSDEYECLIAEAEVNCMRVWRRCVTIIALCIQPISVIIGHSLMQVHRNYLTISSNTIMFVVSDCICSHSERASSWSSVEERLMITGVSLSISPSTIVAHTWTDPSLSLTWNAPSTSIITTVSDTNDHVWHTFSLNICSYLTVIIDNGDSWCAESKIHSIVAAYFDRKLFVVFQTTIINDQDVNTHSIDARQKSKCEVLWNIIIIYIEQEMSVSNLWYYGIFSMYTSVHNTFCCDVLKGDVKRNLSVKLSHDHVYADAQSVVALKDGVCCSLQCEYDSYRVCVVYKHTCSEDSIVLVYSSSSRQL